MIFFIDYIVGLLVFLFNPEIDYSSVRRYSNIMFTHQFLWNTKRTCNTLLVLFDEVRDNVKKKGNEKSCNKKKKNQQLFV